MEKLPPRPEKNPYIEYLLNCAVAVAVHAWMEKNGWDVPSKEEIEERRKG